MADIPMPLRPQVWFDLTSVNLPRAEMHYAERYGAAKAARYFRELADRIDSRRGVNAGAPETCFYCGGANDVSLSFAGRSACSACHTYGQTTAGRLALMRRSQGAAK